MRNGFFDGAIDLVHSLHIHLDGQNLAAERGDFVRQAGVRIHISQPEREVGSGIS